jgi:hypothetical protein
MAFCHLVSRTDEIRCNNPAKNSAQNKKNILNLEVTVMKNDKITEKKIEDFDEIEPLIGEKAASKILVVSYDTLKKTFRYGGLINYVKYKKGVRYRPSDLQKFIDKHLVVVTTD